MQMLPRVYTWFGWSATNAALCGSYTPWQATQNALLWHFEHRPGEDFAVFGCVESQPAGCGMTRPWQRIQLSWPWHLTHFSG
jgi:hypothetical protein